jgi:site-specific recombinase XerD
MDRRGRTVDEISAFDIDQFIADRCQTFSHGTTAGVCSVIRSFLRFLHATRRIKADIALLIVGPVARCHEGPPRALPWPAVAKLLGAVDQSTAIGRRDFAILLLMATYGLGAAEIVRLRLEDVNWENETLRVTRVKTGTQALLPLLRPAAAALIAYLRHGRPHSRVREVFLRAQAPYDRPLQGSRAIAHMVQKYAAIAGIKAPFLGSHVLRHSHATRQIERGANPKVVSDILIQQNPKSLSRYVRAAIERLRDISLPVPR